MLKLVSLSLSILFILSGCSRESGSEIDPLSWAAQGCDVEEVKRLVEEEGFDPVARIERPSRPTYMSSALIAWGRRTAGATHEECVATIQFFLDAGADPTLISDYGEGVPSMVLASDNLPEVLDLFDPSAENWCVPTRSADKSLERIALEDAGWSQADVDRYLSRCRN